MTPPGRLVSFLWFTRPGGMHILHRGIRRRSAPVVPDSASIDSFPLVRGEIISYFCTHPTPSWARSIREIPTPQASKEPSDASTMLEPTALSHDDSGFRDARVRRTA